MWLCTKLGYYSIVQKRGAKFHVRGRLEKDIWNLVEAAKLGDIEVFVSDDTDYRYRFIVDAAGLAKVMTALGDSIDYSNFKDTIHELPDQADKLPVYSWLWHKMCNLQK